MSLDGDLGDWVRGYIAEHQNGPWIKIPADARQDQLQSFAAQMKVIIEEREELNQAIAIEHYPDDIVAFSKDPRVRQNDRDMQAKLKNALNSIWPGSME